MTRRTLLEIGPDIQALDDLLEETGGEIRPEVAEAFEALIAAITAEEGSKLDQCVNYIRRKESEARAAREEAEVYLNHAKSRENRIEGFKRFLMGYLQQTGRKKVETATGRVLAIQANGGVQPMKWLEASIDPETLPPEFVKKEVNAQAVRRGLEEKNPEAMKIAALEERGCHLRIR